MAIFGTLLMVGLRLLLTPILNAEFPFVTLFPAVFFAAWIGGRGPALVSTLVAVTSALFLFVSPAFPAPLSASAQVGTALFVLTGVIAALFGESRLRSQVEATMASEDARKSQDRYRALVERTAEGVWRIDLPQAIPVDLPAQEQIERFYAIGELAECNDVMARMYGFSRAAELTGARLSDLLPSSDPGNLEFLRAFIDTGYHLTDAESHEVGKDGKDRYFLNNLIGVVSDGHLVGAWGSQRDITSVKIAEAAVMASEARFRGVFESGMIGIAFWNREVVTGANDTLLNMLGYDRADLEQGLLRRDRLWTKGDEENDRRATEELQRTGACTPYEKEFLRKDGSKIPVLVGAAGLSPGMDDLVFFLLDLTDRHRAEERIRQAERMEVVGQLAGGMAHEANNQMSVILGATEFILRRADIPPQIRQDAEYIRAAAERTASITRQLLAFSRRQIFQPQVVNLNDVVKKLEPILRRTLTEEQQLVLRLAPEVAAVRADPVQLDQVLLNLALNARDAMPQGGVLTIRTAASQISADYAAAKPGTVITPGSFWVLTVTDTGHGMTREVMKRLFEPFFTTKGVGKGSGLGLAMVYGIVKQSGGYIWPYSELGTGTTFKIYLPSVSESPDVVPEKAPEIPAARGGTVLVVEDDALVRTIARRALTEAGFHVLEASNGNEALDMVGRTPRIDVVITDVAMPELGGRELAQQLSRTKPHLPIIYMSGYTDDDLTRRGLLEPGVPYLEKPFSPPDLARMVHDVLNASHAASTTATT
jgi:PAS domain S-box-containing protein